MVHASRLNGLLQPILPRTHHTAFQNGAPTDLLLIAPASHACRSDDRLRRRILVVNPQIIEARRLSLYNVRRVSTTLYLNTSKPNLGSLRCPSLISPHRVTSDRPSRQKPNTISIHHSHLGVPVCGLSIVALAVSVSMHDYMVVGRSVRGNCPSKSLC
jgi:hypothetical protein